MIDLLERHASQVLGQAVHRARQSGHEGGKSALHALLHELRPERPKPLVRFEGLPGEFFRIQSPDPVVT